MKETSDTLRTYAGTREPPLRQVLDDPIVHLVMRRDKVSLDEVRSVIERARAALYRPGAD